MGSSNPNNKHRGESEQEMVVIGNPMAGGSMNAPIFQRIDPKNPPAGNCLFFIVFHSVDCFLFCFRILSLLFLLIDVQLMNFSDKPSSSSRVIVGEEMAVLIDDLVNCFQEAINCRPNDPTLVTKSSMSLALESEAYKRGVVLSLKLAQVSFSQSIASPSSFHSFSIRLVLVLF
jgi:hypothetical protein